jgi:hypothetical protein
VSQHQSFEANQPPWLRRCALLVVACLLAFVGSMAVAMLLYPGGNWLDRGAVGHRFFANFFCDLTQPVSLSGVDNRWGARWAQFGMLSFAVGLAGFFWILPQHFAAGARVAPWVRGLGECAMLIFVAVPLTPSEQFGNVHAALALLSGAFGLAAALCAVWALARSHRRARVLGALGALTLLVGTFDAVLFVYHLRDVTAPPLLVPATQKIAALLLSSWMAGAAWLALAAPRSAAEPADDRVSPHP